jgi:hypothetical protein
MGNVAGESTFLDEPPFPGLPITHAFRIQLETFTAPDAPAGSGHVSVVRPELGLRGGLPVGERLELRVTGRVATSRYRFRGDPWTRAVPLDLGKAFDLHAARVALEGAWRLDELGPWLAENEVWSVLGTVYGSSRWEDGGFRRGLGAGGAVGVGYEIPGRLHLAAGVSLRTSIEEGGVEPGPLLSLRWDPTERLTLHTRELGLQLDYDLTRTVEIHVAGFRSSDGFRLRGRRGALGDLSFRDRQVRLGTGFDWMLANWLHFELEIGGIVQRRIRVNDGDLGTLASSRADPSVFVDVRFDIHL